MNVIDTASLQSLAGLVGANAATDGFIGVRPENVMVRPAGSGRLLAKVEIVESLGADTLIYSNIVTEGKAPAVQIVARQNTRTTLVPGDAVSLDIAPSSFHLFDRQGRTVSGSGARVS